MRLAWTGEEFVASPLRRRKRRAADGVREASLDMLRNFSARSVVYGADDKVGDTKRKAYG
jgi:hypothetical protein